MIKRILGALSGELAVVILIGLVSTTTAWTAIQASFHGGAAATADADYRLVMAEANNSWLTAELKYRFDLETWEFGIAGSYEYWTLADECKQREPDSQLPDCRAYMDAVYSQYYEAYDRALVYRAEAEVWEGYSNRLQVLTGIFAVALFALGVTSPLKNRKNAAYLVAFAGFLWVVGIGLMINIPIIFI